MQITSHLDRTGLSWKAVQRFPTTKELAAPESRGRHLYLASGHKPVSEGKKARAAPMIDVQQNPKSGVDDFSLSEILADGELCAEIEKWAPPSLIQQGEILFRQGDAPGYAFFVKSGEIALTMHVSGGALWAVRATKGSMVGLPAIVGNEPYSMTAKAIRDSQICKIGRDDFHQLMQQNPRLCCNIVQILAGEVHGARKALSKILVGPPK